MNVRPTQRVNSPPIPSAAPPDAGATPPEVLDSIRRLAYLSLLCIVLAVLFPFPATKIVVAGLLAVPLAVELLTRPPVALAAMVLFLPVFDLVPPLPVPGLNIQTFVSLAAVIGTLRMGSIKGGTPYAGLFWALAGLTTFEMILTLVTTNLPAMEVITQTKAWIGYFPLFFFAARAARESWSRQLTLAAVVLSATMCSLHSVAIFFVKGGGERLRSTGLVGNQPNIYGGYVAMVLPLLVSLALNGTGGRLSRLFAMGGAGLTFFALIFSKSRGAWLAFAAATIVMIVLKKQGKLLILCFILVIFAGSLMPSAFWERLDDTWTDESAQRTESGLDASTQSRITQWEAFPTMFAASPIWGHGLWTFGDVIYEFGLYHRQVSPHSSILRFGVEYGLLGLGLYSLLMLRLIVGAVRSSKIATSTFDRSNTVGLVGAFAALLFADFSGARFFDAEIFAVFCILAGIVSAAMVPLRQRSASPAPAAAPGAIAPKNPVARPRRPIAPVRRG